MPRITKKLKVSIPKVLADQLGLRPGDDVAWERTADALRMQSPGRPGPRGRLSKEERLRSLEAAFARQADQQRHAAPLPMSEGRGWRREDLYER